MGPRRLCSTGLAEVFPTTITVGDLEEMVTPDRARGAQPSRTRSSCTRRRSRRSARRRCGSSSALVLLNITDTKWREHLYEMDYLQEGIHLRAYAQKDPLTEYRREAYPMFEELTESIQDDFVRYIYRVELVRQDEPGRPRPQRVQEARGSGPGRARRGPGQGRGQGAAERALPVWERQEVQEVPRRGRVGEGLEIEGGPAAFSEGPASSRREGGYLPALSADSRRSRRAARRGP